MSQYNYIQPTSWSSHYTTPSYPIPALSGRRTGAYIPQPLPPYPHPLIPAASHSYDPRQPSVGNSGYGGPITAPPSRTRAGPESTPIVRPLEQHTLRTRVTTAVRPSRSRNAYTPAPAAKTPSRAWKEWTRKSESHKKSSRHDKHPHKSTLAHGLSPVERRSRSSRSKYDQAPQSPGLETQFSKMQIMPEGENQARQSKHSVRTPEQPFRHQARDPVPGSSGRGRLYEEDKKMRKMRKLNHQNENVYLPSPNHARTPGQWTSRNESEEDTRHRTAPSPFYDAPSFVTRRSKHGKTSRPHTEQPPVVRSERYPSAPSQSDVKGKERAIDNAYRAYNEVLSGYLTSTFSTIYCDTAFVAVDVSDIFALETESVPGQRAHDASRRERGRSQPYRQHRYWEIVKVGRGRQSDVSHSLKVEIREIHDSPPDRNDPSSVPRFGAPYVYRSLVSRKSDKVGLPAVGELNLHIPSTGREPGQDLAIISVKHVVPGKAD